MSDDMEIIFVDMNSEEQKRLQGIGNIVYFLGVDKIMRKLIISSGIYKRTTIYLRDCRNYDDCNVVETYSACDLFDTPQEAYENYKDYKLDNMKREREVIIKNQLRILKIIDDDIMKLDNSTYEQNEEGIIENFY